jgi:hypothetical protein
MLRSSFCAVMAMLLTNSPLHCDDVATWQTVSVPGVCTFQIPPTLELQGGAYRRVADVIREVWEVPKAAVDRVVAQPAGINRFDAAALKRYARVIVKTEHGVSGDYPRLTDPLAFSEEEMDAIDEQIQREARQGAETSIGGNEMAILSSQHVKLVRIAGIDALMHEYTRTVNDAPPVLVRAYWIFNNDRVHLVTVSWRISEADLWSSDLERVIQSFKFVLR